MLCFLGFHKWDKFSEIDKNGDQSSQCQRCNKLRFVRVKDIKRKEYRDTNPVIGKKIYAVEFNEYEQTIRNWLADKFKAAKEDCQKYTLIEGFMRLPVEETIESNWILGGSTLPAVCVANSETYELRFFALKPILPDLCIFKERVND